MVSAGLGHRNTVRGVFPGRRQGVAQPPGARRAPYQLLGGDVALHATVIQDEPQLHLGSKGQFVEKGSVFISSINVLPVKG